MDPCTPKSCPLGSYCNPKDGSCSVTPPTTMDPCTPKSCPLGSYCNPKDGSCSVTPPPTSMGCCPTCFQEFDKDAQTYMIASAVTFFIIGIPLTVAGAVMMQKSQKAKKSVTGWVVLLVFGIISLVVAVSTLVGALTVKRTIRLGPFCRPNQRCCW